VNEAEPLTMNHGAPVDFELTEEQAALREVSRGLLAVNCPPPLVRSLAAAGQGVDEKLWQRGAELGWHVDVYFEPGTISEFAPILSALPTSYVIDHMGTVIAAKGLDEPAFKALLDLQSSDEKCWVKISGLERASAVGKPFHDAVPFAKLLIDNARDRVLLGTDWPHPNVKIMPNDGEIVDLIPLYPPDPETHQMLLVNNPAKLFKFT